MTRPWDAARIAEARARCEAATDGPWALTWPVMPAACGCSSLLREIRSIIHIQLSHGDRVSLAESLDKCLSAVDIAPTYGVSGPNDGVGVISVSYEEDAALIAAARTDLPEALDEIDRLKAKLQRCDEIRLSQVKELREQDGLIATLRHEIDRLRRGLP